MRVACACIQDYSKKNDDGTISIMPYFKAAILLPEDKWYSGITDEDDIELSVMVSGGDTQIVKFKKKNLSSITKVLNIANEAMPETTD